MTLEETIRQIVREEIRAALRDQSAAAPARESGDPGERLTLAEAAALARRCSATVRRWTETGQLKFVRRGRTILITRGDLDAFLRAEAQPSSDAQIEEMARRMVRGEH